METDFGERERLQILKYTFGVKCSLNHFTDNSAQMMLSVFDKIENIMGNKKRK